MHRPPLFQTSLSYPTHAYNSQARAEARAAAEAKGAAKVKAVEERHEKALAAVEERVRKSSLKKLEEAIGAGKRYPVRYPVSWCTMKPGKGGMQHDLLCCVTISPKHSKR